MRQTPTRARPANYDSSFRENTPLKTAQLEDILASSNEWQNVDSVIRNAITSLAETVKAQAGMIREFERQLPQKAQRAEINYELSSKANISDIQRVVQESVADMEMSLESKTKNHVQHLLEDFASRSDLGYCRVAIDDLRAKVEVKSDLQYIDSEVGNLRSGIEDLRRETSRLYHDALTQRDLTALYNCLEAKANTQDVSAALQEKANEQSVANALTRKADRTDVDIGLSRKADAVNLNHIEAILESKADIINVQSLWQDIAGKLDRSDFEQIWVNEIRSKVDKKEVDYALSSIENKGRELEQSTHRQIQEAQMFTQRLQTDLTRIGDELRNEMQTRAYQSDVEKITSILMIKADQEQVSNLMSETRQEMGLRIDSMKHQFHKDIQAIQEELGDNVDILNRKLVADFQKNDEKQKNTVDEIKIYIGDEMNTVAAKLRDVGDELKAVEGKLRRDQGDEINLVEGKLRENIALDKRASQDMIQRQATLTEDRMNGMEQQLRGEVAKLQDSVYGTGDQHRRNLELIEQQFREEVAKVQDSVHETADKYRRHLDNLDDNVSNAVNQAKLELRNEQKANMIDLQSQVDLKADRVEAKDNVSQASKESDLRLADLRKEIRAALGDIQNALYDNLDKKADTQEIHSLLADKPDMTTLHKYIGTKLEEVGDNRKRIEALADDLNQKAHRSDLEFFSTQVNDNLDILSKELLLKANIKDMITLLDAKTGVEDIQSVLAQIQEDVNSRISIADFNRQIADQATINEALCAENCIGRWIWRSGNIRANYVVPWETQSVNTCPDNFIWDKDKTAIVSCAPGLYSITLSFFANSKPQVQLLINSEVVVLGETSAATKYFGKHTAGNVPGYTLSEYVSLPARARISVTYSGEPGAEGFLGLKKL